MIIMNIIDLPVCEELTLSSGSIILGGVEVIRVNLDPEVANRLLGVNYIDDTYIVRYTVDCENGTCIDSIYVAPTVPTCYPDGGCVLGANIHTGIFY